MFCYQCQETARNTGCTVRGVCGKSEETAALQDLLIHLLKGISFFGLKLKEMGAEDREDDLFLVQALFSTITNAAWDNKRFADLIREALRRRERLERRFRRLYEEREGGEFDGPLPDACTWASDDEAEFLEKARSVGPGAVEDEDVRSLRYALIYGIKGISAYAEHAAVLGFREDEIFDFIKEGLVSTLQDLSRERMLELVLRAGEVAVKTMALLDQANTSTYGHPEMSEVYLGVRGNPGILVSGHDLKDLEELLEQTRGTGIDVYTHGEMLPAHYYPFFKKYDHLVGNYGGSWWHQLKEFESFNGPILLTTNCLVPLRENSTYLDRLFTTGVVTYPGAAHVPDRPEGGSKDFSALIERARSCPPPQALEEGRIVGGFARHQVLALADKVVEAVKSGAIRRFVVMAGCDGRQKSREYFTEVARRLPPDTVILTAGCAKYRYIKLDLGDIGGIPRVLDAGQCNDSYSLAVIALKLKEAFGLDDVNQLPLSFDVAWYEQKAVAVLLALLSLGFKGMRVGPTLPGFLSAAVADELVRGFGLKGIGAAEEDVAAMLEGS
jgi:hydroxylamine reductase